MTDIYNRSRAAAVKALAAFTDSFPVDDEGDRIRDLIYELCRLYLEHGSEWEYPRATLPELLKSIEYLHDDVRDEVDGRVPLAEQEKEEEDA